MLKYTVKRIIGGSSSNVFKGMATLAMGSGIAKLIGIAAIPVLTRLYSPEDFGVLSVFVALVLILSPVLTLRYVLALPLPGHDGLALNLLVLSSGLMLLLTILISFVLWGAGHHLLTLFSMEVLAPWWWLISLGILATATYEMLTLWATRQRDYRIIAQTSVWQSTAGVLTKIILGFLALKPGGLLLGQVVAQGGGIVSLLRNVRGDFNQYRHTLRWSRMRLIAWRYRGFPFYRVPSQFLMVFSVQAPLLFMAFLYDSQTTGQLGLALMAIGLPVQLFGHTLAKAFYAEAANLGTKQADKIRTMVHSVLKRLALFSLPPAVLLIVLGPEVFSLVFGSEWRQAGVFSSILAVYLIFQFVQTPVAHIFYLFDGQKALLWLNVQRGLLIVACFGSSTILDFSPVATIWIYTVFLSGHYVLSVIYALKFIPTKEAL